MPPLARLPPLAPLQKKGGRSKGRQVYVGGYASELEAAHAYDRAVIAYCGPDAPLNVRRAAAADTCRPAWMPAWLPASCPLAFSQPLLPLTPACPPYLPTCPAVPARDL